MKFAGGRDSNYQLPSGLEGTESQQPNLVCKPQRRHIFQQEKCIVSLGIWSGPSCHLLACVAIADVHLILSTCPPHRRRKQRGRDFYLSSSARSFLGRPRGRMVDSKPRSLAVRSVQLSSPY